MACHSLLLLPPPTAPTSSFYSQSIIPPSRVPSLTVTLPKRRLSTIVASTAVEVLVDPEEKNKVHRLRAAYFEKVQPRLKEEFNYTNVHQIPKILKISVNSGIGDAHQNMKDFEVTMNEFAMITGQRPVKTVAQKSIASFKLREGMTLGLMVTLRKNLMWAFLDRLINTALPRVRDFPGVNQNGFDGQGNYNLGIEEHICFPEISPDDVGKNRGMTINIRTTAKTDKEAHRLLTLMGMPFRDGPILEKVARMNKLKPHHFKAKGGRRR